MTRFGNYIGSGSERESDAGEEEEVVEADSDDEMDIVENLEENFETVSQSIVLHEDKKYYPNASDVYGDDVETVTYFQDTESLAQPIIAPVDNKKFTVEESGLPEVYYNRQFQVDMMKYPDQIRNIAIVGHLHHGKTSLLDMLVQETHFIAPLEGKREDDQLRYSDTHVLEQERGFTMKCSPMSLLLENSKGKHQLFNIVDSPGHVDFVDEVAVAGRLTDGFALVVDVVEGLMVNTERIIKHAILENIPFFLVLNKIDRLVLDLKLPLEEAYFKIVNVLDTINSFIIENSPTVNRRVSPELGNVVFASASLNWCFTLKSFAEFYQDWYPDLDVDNFVKRLWGNIYYNSTTKQFSKDSAAGSRSFIHFILTPIYKIFSYSLSYDKKELKPVLAKLGIKLKESDYKLNARPLLKIIFKQFFGNSHAFTDTVLDIVPSSKEAAKEKINRIYTGDLESPIIKGANECNAEAPLLIDCVKLYPSSNAKEMYVFGRVYSGTLSIGQTVKVLGEEYTPEDDEDMATATITDMWTNNSRYKVAVTSVPAGNWVLVAGIAQSINKYATVIADEFEEDAYIFKPPKAISQSVFKIAVEPVNPSELPKMLEGLRSITKAYVLATTRVEESGEHVLLGSGEVYMDCIMHDLRKLYSEIDIKVSDPATRFSETCLDMSAIKCNAETPNKKNTLSIVAEPLDRKIVSDIENGKVNIDWSKKEISQFFQKNYDWDVLAANSIWAFGPETDGPNLLQDDTLPGEVDKKLVGNIREFVRQGFSWSTREGPLCEEPLRGVKFKLIDAQLAQETMYRGAGQIIPTARRACYSSFLLASPRLMEPLYSCRAICSATAVPIVYDLLSRRRGNVLLDSALPGTPLYSVTGTLPVIDSFGFETDVRVATKGEVEVSLVFDSWQLVPGDPLDRTQKTAPLKPAAPQGLARDFVLKTRRRKGLSEEPTVIKYLDASVVESLRESGLLDV